MAPNKRESIGDLINCFKNSKLDIVVRMCAETKESGIGAKNIVCGRPVKPCAPCGSCGPVRCPCMLKCAPIGPQCCCIEQPRCISCVPGCCMCCNPHGLPVQPSGKPRCCRKRCV